jgi:hypothetical protein
VLKGLEKTICESRPAMMVELQVHYEEIFEMLTSLGYSVFRADRTRVPDATGLYIGGPNFFFIDAQDKTRLTPFAASRL